ncbi:VOC family protein [Xylanimonas protaetiae]|uniref:VOC family protein n=1 Tax=Xylanimonas protaetiae TaxID=2509457 RepID=A0A4P6F4Y4_9MICO|nr:VOC family protein [Xylanimonas protaetiae]QAY70664.1 VOC family protein [Xylanimonas protaetiae]
MFLNHVEIQCSDFDASARFYDAVLAALGAARQEDKSPHAIGYGTDGPEFWIGVHRFGEGFRESHLAFTAPSPEAVDAFLAAAKEVGAEVLHEARDWPEYQGGPMKRHYAAFVRDPDGNNVEAAFQEFDFTWFESQAE